MSCHYDGQGPYEEDRGFYDGLAVEEDARRHEEHERAIADLFHDRER